MYNMEQVIQASMRAKGKPYRMPSDAEYAMKSDVPHLIETIQFLTAALDQMVNNQEMTDTERIVTARDTLATFMKRTMNG